MLAFLRSNWSARRSYSPMPSASSGGWSGRLKTKKCRVLSLVGAFYYF